MCVGKGIWANVFEGPHLFEHPKLARPSIKECVRNFMEFAYLFLKAHWPAWMNPDVDEKFVDGFWDTKCQRKEGDCIIFATKLMTESNINVMSTLNCLKSISIVAQSADAPEFILNFSQCD